MNIRSSLLTTQSSHAPTAIRRFLRGLLGIVVAGSVLQSATAQAGTITQTKSTTLLVGIPVPPPTVLTFDKFDTHLGVLTEVKYTYSLGFDYGFTVSPATGSGTVDIRETFSLADGSGSGFNISHAGQTGRVSFPTASRSYFIQAGTGGPGGPYFPAPSAYQASGASTFEDTVTFDEMTFHPPPGYTATPSYEARIVTVTLTYTFTPLTNFYDIQASFYARFVPPPDLGHEDEELSPFKRWEQFWEERLYPSGDFAIAAQAYTDYLHPSVVPPHRAAAPASTPAVTANWSPLGPDDNPGHGLAAIGVIALDPRFGTGNPPNMTMYACSTRGGVWKTLDEGLNWSERNTGLPLINVSSIAVDPHDPNTIYVGASCRSRGAVDVRNECVSQGIYKTVNGGTSWAPTGVSTPSFAEGFEKISAILIDPSNSNIVFAATSVGLYMSTNATTACTWTLVQPGYFRTVLFKPSSTVLYAAGDDIWKSADGGATWTRMTGPGTGLDFSLSPFAGFAIQNINLAVSSADPERLYAAINTTSPNPCAYPPTPPALQVYSFNGTSWTQKVSPYCEAEPVRDPIVVSPTDANVVLLGGLVVYRSTNGGSSWSSVSGYNDYAHTHGDILELKFLPHNGHKVLSGTDGGVSKTDNILASSVTWTEIDHGIEAALMYNLSSSVTQPDLIRTGHQDTGCNLYDGSQPPGSRWSNSCDSCGDGFEQLIDWSNPAIMYATTYSSTINGLLYKSVDRGVSFSLLPLPYTSSGALWGAALAMDPVMNTTLYQGRHDVFKTINSGNNWSPISNFLGEFGTGPYQAIKAMAVAPSDPNYIYTSVIAFSPLDYLTTLFRTTTGGGPNQWTNVTPAPPPSNPNPLITGIAVDPSNPQRVAISFSGYLVGTKVKVSTDAGAHWMDYNDGLPNMPCNHIVWQQGTDQLYVATDVGVYYRNGSMPAWAPFNDNLPNVSVQWLEINNLAGKIRAATYGRGLWESDLPPAPAPECDLSEGKVVFVSNRVSPQQLFVQHVSNFGAPPLQITQSSFPVQHPTWSPDGQYIAYIDTDIIVGPSGSTKVSALAIIDEAGVQHFWLQAPFFGTTNLSYPEWSPSGDKIVVTTWSDIATSELKIITFTAPGFSNYTISTLVPSGPEPWQRSPVEADFSPDGNFAYYGAGWSGSVSTLWKVPVTGNVTPTQLFELLPSGGLAPIVRGFALSVSPDGARLIYNSELYRDHVPGYIDEELLQLDLVNGGTTGVITQLTQQAGNQAGFFAKGGSGQYAGFSNMVVGGNGDIFLCKPNASWAGSGPCGSPTCVKLDIGDPNNMYNDDYPSWWIGP